MIDKRVLFTSPFAPFGVDDEFGHRDVHAEFFPAHLTRNQGIFEIRSVNPFVNLHVLAKNIRTPSTVLEYPTIEAYVNELRTGTYSHVAITTVIATNPKARKMVQLAREYAPNAKVIIGGYGVAIEQAKDYFGADYLCKGDGVKFIRELFGEKNRPFVDPLIESRPSHVLGFKLDPTLYIVGSLGCSNGCDFCITSHFFNCKNEKILKNGKDLFNLIKEHRAKNYDRLKKAKVQTIYIFSENFLADKLLLEEFGQLVKSFDNDIPISIGCFGSAAAVAQYDPEFLAKIGISNIWIGVESRLFNHNKLNGIDLASLFDSLKRHGIVTIGSAMLGFPFHTPENIYEDVDYLFSLKPTFCQFTIYSPTPGTPSYEKAKRNGWINDEYDYRLVNGFNEYFEHPNFKKRELHAILSNCLAREIRELGPSIFRYLEVVFNKYDLSIETKDSVQPSYTKQKLENILTKGLMALPIGIFYKPTQKKTLYLLSLISKIISRKKTGLIYLFLSPIVIPLILVYVLLINLMKGSSQPNSLRFEYNRQEQCTQKDLGQEITLFHTPALKNIFSRILLQIIKIVIN